MLAWQYSWFSSYLQGDAHGLGLLLLSLDIVSSLKPQAEIIRAVMMSTERIRELHFPTAELVPPLPYEEDSERCWDRHGLSQLLGTCPAPAGRAGLPARPAGALIPAAHPQEKVPQAAGTGQWLLTWTKLGCTHHAACWGRPRAARLLRQAFSQDSVLPPRRHPLSLVCWGSQVRSPCFMSVSGHICGTNSRAELRHPVLQFYSSQVFLISQGCTTS